MIQAETPIEQIPSVTPVVTAPSRDASNSAGVGFLLALSAGVTGAMLGGIWGAGAGLLTAGGLRNADRAWGEWRSGSNSAEASKSAMLAAIGLAAAGWMGYHAVNNRNRSL